MIKSLATILAIGALAATPAFAQQGGGAGWNSGFQPTHNNQAYGNQGPTWQGGQQSNGSGTSNGSWNGGQQGQAMYNQGMNNSGMSYGSDELSQNTIEQVQEHLQRLGLYHGAIDGQWGPETSQAIGEFQGQHGLRPTGNLTLPTVERLGMLNGNGNGNSNYTQNGGNQGYNGNNAYHGNNTGMNNGYNPSMNNGYGNANASPNAANAPSMSGSNMSVPNYNNAFNGQPNGGTMQNGYNSSNANPNNGG